jgi:polar amino acid transport system substrate-binding protein
MNRLFAALALGVALLLGSAAHAVAGDVFDDILARNELVVGTSPDYPPLSFRAPDGTIKGAEIDLARRIAVAMGVDLRVIGRPFSELLPALEAGEFHMVISALTMTPERNTRVAFVGPYMISGQNILGRKERVAAVRSFADMNRPDFSIAVALGTTSETVANQLLPEADIVVAQSLDVALHLLRNGQVDALMADQPYVAVAEHRYKSEGLAKGDTPFTFEPLGIALPPDDPLLINWLQNFLFTFEGSGQLDMLFEGWFKNLPAQDIML